MKTLAILFFLIVSVAGYSQNKQYPPRNEVAKDPSLQLFVNSLHQAIEKKDEGWLISVLDDEVSSDIGGEGGKKEFKEIYKPENDTSKIWPILNRIISLGGVFLHDEGDETGKYQFVFPYVYDVDLEIEDDYFSLGVITGKIVNLRSEPNTFSKVVVQLNYDVVLYTASTLTGAPRTSGSNEMGGAEWYRVETYDHANVGWVNWQYVYSPMDYRLFLFKNPKGEWKISALLSGD